MDLRALAHHYGFFPCNDNKSPNTALCGDHNRFREGTLPTEDELAQWKGQSIGIWCGQKGLQCIDVDVDGIFGDLWKSMYDNGLEDTLLRCAVAETPFGHHIWCLVPGCTDGSTKLAKFAQPIYSMERDKMVQTIIETRGVGGYALISPSPGYRFESAHLLDLEPISLEEWKAILSVCRLYDESTAETVFDAPTQRGRPTTGKRPGDDYNERGTSLLDLLGAEGWQQCGRSTGGRIAVRRPGKSGGGISGTVTADGACFYCFSSNAPPFDENKAYSRFGVYTLLNHKGDFASAAKALASDGYGERATKSFDVTQAEAPDVILIETNGVPLIDMVDAAVAAIGSYNAKEPRVFQRSGMMVEVACDEEGRQTLRQVDTDRLQYILAKAARFVSSSEKRGCVDVVPPKAVISSILTMPDLWFLPPLAQLTNGPAYAGGKIVLNNGYCPTSRLYVATTLGWRISPESGHDCAQWLMKDVLGDFPFQSMADRANALALMVLPFVRPAISGPTPLHLIDAPTQGTGKSLLGKVCALPATGKSPSAFSAPLQEDEWAKCLLANLSAARPVVLIDNISRKVDSDSLAAALTSNEYEGRLLGVSRIVSFPVRCCWIGTSNNAQLSTDIARRTVSIRLNSNTEKPWQRDGFAHPDILGWVSDNRVEIVSKILGMVAAWVAKGCQNWSGKPLGSYEIYSKAVGGVLEACGVKEFLGNWETMFEATTSSEVGWKELYAKWWDTHSDHPLSAGQVWKLAGGEEDAVDTCEDVLGLCGSGNKRSQVTKLGYLLKLRMGRICGGMRIERHHNVHNSSRFKMSKNVDVGDVVNPLWGVSEIRSTDGINDTPIGDWQTPPTSPTSTPIAAGPDGADEALDLGFEPHRPAEEWKPLLPEFESMLEKIKDLEDNKQ